VPRPADDELRVLMHRYQEGDHDAFREIYATTAMPIQRYLGRWSDAARAADLTQDTFLQIHRARRTYRPELPVLPWMFAIARHVALQSLRTRGRRVVEDQSDDLSTLASVRSAEGSVLARHDLALAMSALSADEQEIVWLADIEGLSSSEIARVIGTSEGAARVRLHRAHQRMRASLDESKTKEPV
jgi:RNA polymerase sigma-70 factor (ECF subfamily)